jgi:hypothetical protein
MGFCHHLRFAAIPVAQALASATKGAGAWARLPEDVTFLEAPGLKDWS